MRKRQWQIFAVGFILLGVLLGVLAIRWNQTCMEISGNYLGKVARQLGLKGVEPINVYDLLLISDMQRYTTCVIKAQSYAIPSFICIMLAIAYSICGLLERKKDL